MSIILLYVLISNCSRESLYLWGERRIVTISLSVGRGIGPEIFAPLFFIVSTIRLAASSTSSWSYAANLILIFCTASLLLLFVYTNILFTVQLVRVYRGVPQNKNSRFVPSVFAKPRLVAGIKFPLLSAEIIC